MLSVVCCLGSSLNASSRTNGTCQSWRYDRRSDQSCRTICTKGREEGTRAAANGSEPVCCGG